MKGRTSKILFKSFETSPKFSTDTLTNDGMCVPQAGGIGMGKEVDMAALQVGVGALPKVRVIGC